MKKILLIFFILSGLNGFAQLAIEPRVGLGITDFSGINQSESNIGYKLGVSVDCMFTPSWGIRTGFFVTQKGVRDSKGYINNYLNPDDPESAISSPASLELKPNYLEIPVGAVYRYTVDPNVSVGVNMGGYIACGYGGNQTGKLYYDFLQAYQPINIFDKDANHNLLYDNSTYEKAKRVDCGLNGGVFADVYHFTFSVNYD
ncbi:MAG: PorT family protein [Candidatus Azobacteroides sp.]|nr:PorT family protein [Candidatus Azobacteroides sp.]